MSNNAGSNAQRLANLRAGNQQRTQQLMGHAAELAVESQDRADAVRPPSEPVAGGAAAADRQPEWSEPSEFGVDDPRSGCRYEWQVLRGSAQDAEISVEVLQAPFCAHILAGVPLLRGVRVRAGRGLRQPVLRLSIQPSEYFGESRQTLAELRSGQQTELRAVRLPYRPELFASRMGLVDLLLQVTLEDGGLTVFAGVHPLQLSPALTVPCLAATAEDALWLAATAIRPNATGLMPLVRRVGDVHRLLDAGGTLQGYHPIIKQLIEGGGGQTGVQVQSVVNTLQACCQTLHEHLAGYLICPPAVLPDVQRIRSAEEIFVSRHGNCLDYSVLTAGLLEALVLDPFLVLVPGHAIAGCLLVPSSLLPTAVDRRLPLISEFWSLEDLAEWCGGAVVFLECTAISEHSDLKTLQHLAWGALERAFAGVSIETAVAPVRVLSVRTARELGIQPIP